MSVECVYLIVNECCTLHVLPLYTGGPIGESKAAPQATEDHSSDGSDEEAEGTLGEDMDNPAEEPSGRSQGDTDSPVLSVM